MDLNLMKIGETMTNREKLIELIGQVQYLGGLELALADHLIDNGVHLGTNQATSDENKQWIPVSERLPVDWCPVLVMVRDVGRPLLGSYRENVWFHEQWNTTFINGAVTHWMPLPEAPKEESK